MIKFAFRKILYVGLGTATAALAVYLHGGTDISDWTLKGAGIAIGTALWGTLLSGVIGGSLSKTK